MMDASLLSGVASFLVDTAAAANPPLPQCQLFNLPGCGGGPDNVLATSVIPNVAIFLLRVVAASSVVFIVFSGMSMILAQGDSGKVSKARYSVLYAMFGLGIALSAQLLVSYVVTEDYGQTSPQDFIISGLLASSVRIMLTLINAILGVIILIQGFRMVYSQGKSDQFTTARTAIIHAIIGAVIVNAAVALVRIVSTFFGV